MTEPAATVALLFGGTGRLGRVMRRALDALGIDTLAIGREALSRYLDDGVPPPLPPRLMLVDASIDYANLRGHEADKQAMIADIARRHEIELVASFSSGAVDFDDALITNPSYRDYKRVKQDNLAFFQSLGARLFYPKIYTLVGPSSYAVKTTGWVQVLDQATNEGAVSIAHPHEPRSWVSERGVERLFASFATGERPDYLGAPVSGTFRLADIVAFCDARHGRKVAIGPGQATPWLRVPYVAPEPDRVGADDCDLQATLASLRNAPQPH